MTLLLGTPVAMIFGRRNHMDRTEAARAISKVFAYLNCGKRDSAREWAKILIAWLETI
jgi:hypothetical protein